MALTLFSNTLRAIIQEAPPNKQLEIYHEIVDVVNSSKREITLVISYDRFFLSNVSLSALKMLDPKLLDSNIMVLHRFRDNPYLIRVVQRLGPWAGSLGLAIIKIKLGLAETYRIQYYHPTEYVYSVFLRHPTIQPENIVRPLEEVDAIIDTCIEKYDIKLDPKEMESWKREHDQTDRFYELKTDDLI